MMHNNKLAVAIKTNGKVLREVNDTVYIPFGSEYSIFIKNLNSVRASVSISVDGDDIADGDHFVVHPNSTVEVERFIRNGNNDQGNRLKFIERTSGIEQHRGIEADDGLIRIEFTFEKPYVPLPIVWNSTIIHEAPSVRRDIYYKSGVGSNSLRSMTGGIESTRDTLSNQAMFTSNSASVTSEFAEQDAAASSGMRANETGITTEGSVSDQRFTTVANFPLEATSTVMVIKLLGETADNKVIREPVTVKTKPKCNKCGTVAPKYNSKFCSNCGTSLTIV